MIPIANAIPIHPSVRIIAVSILRGEVLRRLDEPAHSWTRNFYNGHYTRDLGLFPSGSSWGAGYLSWRSTDGTYRAPNRYDAACFLDAPANDSNFGILTGRGSDPVAMDDYALQTPITHGNGANQLSHRAQAAPSPGYTSGTKTWLATLTRRFDNTSGSTITVTECGLIGSSYSSNWKLLLCRDILSSAIDVLNNGTLTLTYEISFTFPS